MSESEKNFQKRAKRVYELCIAGTLRLGNFLKLGLREEVCCEVFECAVLKVQNLYSSLAQSVEHSAVNRSVAGSSPAGGVFL